MKVRTWITRGRVQLWLVAGLSLIPITFFTLPIPALSLIVLLLAPGPLWFVCALVCALGTISFWLWNPRFLGDCQKIPLRSTILLSVISAFSVFYLFTENMTGIQYQGKAYTVSVTLINFALMGLLWALRHWSLETPSFAKNLLFHWLLFAWLFSCAFPGFGEVL